MSNKVYVIINMKEMGTEIFTIKKSVAEYLGIHRNSLKFEDGMFFHDKYCVVESEITVAKKLNRR